MKNIKVKIKPLLTISLVCTFIITVLFYIQSIKVIDKTVYEKIYNTLNYNAMIIENKIENTELLSHQLTTLIKTTIPYEMIKDNPESMKIYKNNTAPIVEDTIESFKARTGWIVFNTNEIVDGGTLSYSKEKDKYVREPEYDVHKSGYSQQAWWVVAERNGSSWSTPYYWEPWNATIITYSEQININGILIAMAGSELYFNDIAKQLEEAKLYDSGHMTLLNEEYKVLYDFENSLIGKDYVSIAKQHPTFIDQINSNKKIDIIYDLPNNTNHIFAYIKLDNGWILLTNLSKKEIHYDLNQLNLKLVMTILSLILFAQISSRFIHNRN